MKLRLEEREHSKWIRKSSDAAARTLLAAWSDLTTHPLARHSGEQEEASSDNASGTLRSSQESDGLWALLKSVKKCKHLDQCPISSLVASDPKDVRF